MNLGDKAEKADYVIDNSDSWACVRQRVVGLGNELSERFAG